MIRYISLLLFIGLAFWGCEEEKEEALPVDCLGVEGGTAYADSCGTCDDNSSNDCSQDCAGEWGGQNICGCTDSTATNYDSTATFDDESCEYDTTVVFIKTYGGSENDSGKKLLTTIDGGYIIVGYTDSFGNGENDVWLIKTDNQGNEEWSKTFGGVNIEIGSSIMHTSDGGYIVTGYTRSFGNGENDFWLIKTDSQGNEEWSKTFGGSDNDIGIYGEQTIDGGYILTGWTYSFGNGKSDIWLIKTDSQGNEEWSKTFGEGEYEFGKSVKQTSDSGYIIIGYTDSFGNGENDVWLIKTDSQGNEEWSNTFGGSNGDTGESIQETTDGGYIITGFTHSFHNGNGDVWLIKTDSNGNEIWNQSYGENDADYGHSVQQTNDNGYIICGSRYILENQQRDGLLIKTDSQGNEEWSYTFGGSDNDEFNFVKQTVDDGYIMTGLTGYSANNNSDVWLIKTDLEGNTVPYDD